MLNNLFEILTTAADVSSFISLKKTFDNHDQLHIIQRLDKQDDILFNTILKNQNIIIKLLGGLIMDIQHMLDKIVENNNKQDMDCLGYIFTDLLYRLKDTDKARYNEIKYKMHKMLYGEHLTEDLAHKWVARMQNKDGTFGEHWTYAQTEEVRKQYASDQHDYDFYAVLNMIYSDYYCEAFNTEQYVMLAKDWLNDSDVAPGKTLRYYMLVVK